MAEILKLKRIVDIEYSDITIDSNIYHDKLRVFLKDGSVADIWFSTKITGRFSYHWERRQINGKMYRHDNFPDPQWKGVSTYPKHFHNGSQNNTEEPLAKRDSLKLAVALSQLRPTDFCKSLRRKQNK